MLLFFRIKIYQFLFPEIAQVIANEVSRQLQDYYKYQREHMQRTEAALLNNETRMNKVIELLEESPDQASWHREHMERFSELIDAVKGS